ncbi:MAG TPA: hypothetical protein PK926_13015 [Spirochaetota bacterium]|nr:hypothetical protein [Spirochaetota bacterium]HPI89555.1 hypothetical protein [Spirochaetota bacterium]HPR49019.1 hypothetical protein [Spirochaetota bacterium]
MLNRKMRSPVILLLVAFMLSCAGGRVKDKSAATDSQRGRAEGWAKIFDDDTALARDRALEDARKKLVEKMLGTTISGKKIVENYRLVSSIIEAKMSGLVRDEVVVKEWQEGSIYKVVIEGTVEPAAVDDIVKKAIADYGRPKFLLLIEETVEGKKSAPGFTETELVIQNMMGDAGFDFVDNATVKTLMQKEKSRMNRAIRGDVASDVRDLLLNKNGAEVVITGTTEVSDQSKILGDYNIKDMKSKSAIIRLKAVDVYTGSILVTASKQAAGLHINDETAAKYAIGNALKQIVGSEDENGLFKSGPFINSIAAKFIQATSRRQIVVNVAGLDYKDMTKFRNDITQRIRGVQEVISKGQSGKYANLEVYFAGRTTDFTDELVFKAEKFGFSIEILDTYPNSVTLKAQRIK